MHGYLAIVITWGFFTAGPVFSQEKIKKNPIVLHPAPEPVPALKYRLLPELRDVTQGDAVQLYYRASVPQWWKKFTSDAKLLDKVRTAITTPLKDLPGELAWLKTSDQLQDLDRAARRSYCAWDLNFGLREDGDMDVFPGRMVFLDYGRLLAVRSRYELAERKFDRAIRGYQTGMGMGRHVGGGPSLMHALVGAACATLVLEQVETWIQQPGSPNLYWALTNLPRPFVDFGKAMEAEKIALDSFCGRELRDMLGQPKLEPFSPSRIRLMQQRLSELLGQSRDEPNMRQTAATIVAVALLYPEAKQFLLDKGRTAAEVEALPMIQVVLLHFAAEYDRVHDDMSKWFNVPFPEAWAGLQKFGEKLEEMRNIDGPAGARARLVMLGGYYMIGQYREFMSLERRIDALRILEALRLHAAAHKGELPESLDDIKEAPVPLDPITGKSFEYRRKGDRAVLVSPVPAGETRRPIRYDITMTPTK